MSWTETHRRWQALREVEALANAGCTELPWNEDYAAIFGDRDGLAAALRYRWELARSTQLDTHLAEPVLEQQRSRFEERNAGIVAMLRRHLQDGHAGVVPEQRRAHEVTGYRPESVPA
jgi:hypothetical protein